MGRHDKLILKVLAGSSDANIEFDELLELLKRLGFDLRVRGSHHLLRKQGVEERINLQRDGAKAKPYQVRQVRAVLVKYHFAGEED
ncbi:MAG: type II toxin-antitoxin system HicA family toxin [Gammaproteobacteria bacterium]|nr:type II toxin-antitoxin system HicA family toxin [Gammaproteobacteria bacterium]